ncbi:hypothetical protein EMIHUDRAFT_441530 [Emiliania huxleyi CCMP1516]|uniref:Uncharacterized protein n=2 Tax=Emiliania huxleyi TaxID=2903 RepID=A0A0D3KCU7_EMIH1|nr:hypothetical protein EMIHUDRAFT_441530 [Emiliania huxleyi CCMP1516]EOD33582.1 hypothetical protein EMIHUDRAFT_441530 [Emiliania huxleyi CCMP1516]|eukprot:XP_005786011.1 hypothetical protein EMIHUDRAFT_441530 [Emiliania huxleyi CCMP1516]
MGAVHGGMLRRRGKQGGSGGRCGKRCLRPPPHLLPLRRRLQPLPELPGGGGAQQGGCRRDRPMLGSAQGVSDCRRAARRACCSRVAAGSGQCCAAAGDRGAAGARDRAAARPPQTSARPLRRGRLREQPGLNRRGGRPRVGRPAGWTVSRYSQSSGEPYTVRSWHSILQTRSDWAPGSGVRNRPNDQAPATRAECDARERPASSDVSRVERERAERPPGNNANEQDSLHE